MGGDGTLYWITGLPGAGKSTVARALVDALSETGTRPMHLDGDDLRAVLGVEGEYDMAARLELARRYARLCAHLVGQGFDVVCSTVSLFPEIWRWNREHVRNYREIYLRVDMAVLERRDQKRLYSEARAGRIDNVVGIDIPLVEPPDAHVVVDNDGSEAPDAVCRRILDAL